MKRAMMAAVRWYQRNISAYTKPCCRFYPTCSNYALQAIEKHGAWKGGWLALFRILRCNPLFRGGVDLVPEPKQKTKKR